MNETYAIVSSCIGCTAPANLLATLAIILVGVGLAARFERANRQLARSKAPRPRRRD